MCRLSVMSVKLNIAMVQTLLSGATAKASSCVRDLMAEPGKVSKVLYSLLLSFSRSVSLPKEDFDAPIL